MSGGEVALVAAGIAGAAYLMRRHGTPAPRRASWDVPPIQRQHAERLREAAALYQAGRGADARIVLRDRALDWNLIARAAAAHPLDPTAHRIAAAINRDGVGMFLGELHSRLSAADREHALDILAQALTDYTGPTDERSAR